MENPVEKAILTATNENLQGVDGKLLKDVADLINQRSDYPKLAIQSLVKRLMMIRNNKVQLLTLELIEFCAYVCDVPFQTQIASNDFLQRLNMLFQPAMNKEVQQRALQVLAALQQLMSSHQDLFPNFFQFLQKLQQRFTIPNNYESKYAVLKKQPTYSSKPSISTNPIVMASSGTDNPKTAKLKKDLEIVKSNINLTNEIIDSSDPNEDVLKNDILSDMLKTLKGVEDKLRNLITNMSGSDETMMSYCLELNDDLMKTFERYNSLKAHKKPTPFKIEQFAFSNQQQNVEQKNIDWNMFSAPIQSQQPQGQRPQPQQVQQPIKKEQLVPPKQIDLLDLFEDSSPQKPSPPIPQNIGKVDLMDAFSNEPQQQQAPPQQQIQGQQQSPVQGQLQQPQVPNLNNLYGQQQQPVPQQLAQQTNPNQVMMNRYSAFNQPQMMPTQVPLNQGFQGQMQSSMMQPGMVQQQGMMQPGMMQPGMILQTGVMQSSMMQPGMIQQSQAQNAWQLNQMQQQMAYMNLSQKQGQGYPQANSFISQQPQQSGFYSQGNQVPQPYIAQQSSIPAVSSQQKKPFDDLDELFGVAGKKSSSQQSQNGGKDLI